MIANDGIFKYPVDNISLMRTKWLITNFYHNHRNIVDFNKNIIISAIITALCDIVIVMAASSIFHTNNFLISLTSLVADFSIFNSFLLFLLYSDNKRLLLKPKQGDLAPSNKSELKTLVLKLLATLGLSEISYLTIKFISTYFLLAYIDLTSSQLSISTTILAWITYLVTANIMLKKTDMFS